MDGGFYHKQAGNPATRWVGLKWEGKGGERRHTMVAAKKWCDSTVRQSQRGRGRSALFFQKKNSAAAAFFL
jgi:hypothetical protein